MLGLALLLTSCGEIDPASLEDILRTQKKPQTQAPVELPVRWTLTDTEGKTLEADIVGRTPTTITIIRIADQKQFDVPIERLSEADRARIKTLSMSMTSTINRSSPNTALINMRKASLKETQDRMAELLELYGVSQSGIQMRSYASELRRLRRKEAELTAELKRLQGSR